MNNFSETHQLNWNGSSKGFLWGLLGANNLKYITIQGFEMISWKKKYKTIRGPGNPHKKGIDVVGALNIQV